jgi:tripartite-type tricarboxylate transporter receptor subunit TctC
LGEKAAFDFSHISLPGSSPSINALTNGDADFAVLLSVEAVGALRSGQIRALAAFTEDDFIIRGENEILIPSLPSATAQDFGEFLPFGEYFGLFMPNAAPQANITAVESMLQNPPPSFEDFIRERGLIAIPPSIPTSAAHMNRLCPLICQTLRL